MLEAAERVGAPARGAGLLAVARTAVRSFARRHWAVLPVLALAAFLCTFRLDQNGYGNTYYSGAVKSMSLSWKAFFFGSIDTSNFITVDKPPVALQVQALSVRIFGFSTWSLLLPEALAAVAACGVLYASVRRSWGEVAGVVSALALALTPITAAVARVNLPDSVLVLLLVGSGWAALRAVEDGRMRWALLAAVLVGVAFNVKMLQAFIVVPSLGLVYVLAAPLPWRRRLLQLGAATIVLAAVSGSWMLIVDSLPKDAKPYIGGSTDGTVRDLVFGYNGLGRINGDERPGAGGPPSGAPGQTGAPGGAAPGQLPEQPAGRPAGQNGAVGAVPAVPGQTLPQPGDRRPGAPAGAGDDGRGAFPDGTGDGNGAQGRGGPGGGPGFGGQPGWTRLFNDEIGTQITWLIPFAIGGAIVAFILRGKAPLRDARRAAVIFWAGWALTHAIVFSKAQGIFHPYYTSALAPGLAALAGIGAVAFIEAARRWRMSVLGAAATVGATVALQLAMLDRAPSGWHAWLGPAVVAGSALATLGLVFATLMPWRRLAEYGGRVQGPAMLGSVAALLLVPGFWSFTVLDTGTNGTMPAANPSGSGIGRGFPGGGPGGPGGPGGQTLSSGLLSYLGTNRGEAKWMVAVNGSQAAAPLIIQTGQPVMAMGGFSGTDPAPTVDQLKRLIAAGEIRFFLLGGGGFTPGARGGTQSPSSYVTANCTAVDPATYGGSGQGGAGTGNRSPGGIGRPGGIGERLYDCGAQAGGTR